MRTILVLLSVCSLAAAQTAAVELPAAATQWPGPWLTENLFYHPGTSGNANEARTQLIYDLQDVPGQFTTARSLAFRSIGVPLVNPAVTLTVDVRMSTSPADPANPSRTFAQNAGATTQQVFLGAVSLPAEPGGTWPRPWRAAIPLQTPFALLPAAGDRALVVDVRCWNNQSGSPWFVEVYDLDRGLADTELIQMDCLDPTGAPQASWTISNDLLVPGGSVGLAFYNLPPNQPSLQANVLCLGVEGVGGSFGGLPLPFVLSAVGVPSPPNCRWAVNVALSAPMQYLVQFGIGFLDSGLAIPIPNVAGLIGLRLVAQDAMLMQYPTGTLVFPSAAVRFTIRSGQLPSGSFVTAPGNRNAAIGVTATSTTAGGTRYGLPISMRMQ